ncbi:MAG: sugar phosphate isomerase/epimerase [Spirochaetes bacterium]|nr:sugar phosphate isomerase/epimerase [Spirochaetota bacterium]
MKQKKIGIITESFRRPVRESLRLAKELGADGVQMYAVKGDVSPETDGAARKDLAAFIHALGLEISALCGDLGGHGFAIAADNTAKVERSKRIVDLAVDLGTNVVTTHIGVVPKDKNAERYRILRDACGTLAHYAASKGVTFAIETGPETADVLGAFLGDIGSKGIGVNLDPANLVMVTGDDPVKAVRTLSKYIVHTHAKDGVKLAPCDAEQVYDAFAKGGIEGFDFGKLFNEVPLGEGGVQWDAYLKALDDIGYTGYLTIEREVGADPSKDIAKAVQFLRDKIRK